LILGLDFGTSTTGVSELDALGRRRLLNIGFQGSDLIPSLIAESDSGTWHFGQEALLEFKFKRTIRFIKECKNFIGNSPEFESNDAEDAIIAKFLSYVLEQVKLKYNYDATKDEDIQLRVSCPAGWNWKQRSRLLSILINKVGARVSNAEIVDEPSAAGVNFTSFLEQQTGRHRTLVFDMGGGTLDIAVLEVPDSESGLTVLSARSEPIAGSKLDDLITLKFLQDALKSLSLTHVSDPDSADLSSVSSAIAKRLSLEATEAQSLIDWVRFRVEDLKKSDLAQGQNASIPLFLEFLKSGFPKIDLGAFDDFDIGISDEQFEEMVEDFLNSARWVINRTIQDSLFTGRNLDEINARRSEPTQTIDFVILAGGMANVSAVRNWVDKVFPGKLVEAYFGDPQNLVATGLAPSTLYEMNFAAKSQFRPNFHLACGEKIFLYAYTPLFDINPGSRDGLFLRTFAEGPGYIKKLNLLLESIQSLGYVTNSGRQDVSIYPDGRMFLSGQVWNIFTGQNLTEKPAVPKGCPKCGRRNCPGICSN
jgi:molecular chaperone DnaK (HSP70)